MKTKIVIESGQELIKFACLERPVNDRNPIISNGKIIFENGLDAVRLEADGFELDRSVDVEQVLSALCKNANLKCLIT